MAADPVHYALRDGVAVITMDDGKANALSPARIVELNAALDRAGAEAQAVLLAGRPGRFSAGFDLKVMTGGADGLRELVTAGANLALRLYAFPRPVVAACTGHALAAGAVLLCAADLRIGASGDFKIGLNEVSIQLPLPIFALELARDRLSKRWFTQAVTQARIFDPPGARDAGYLDLLATPETLLAAAFDHAARLATLPAPAFELTKERERGASIAHIRATLAADMALLTAPVA